MWKPNSLRRYGAAALAGLLFGAWIADTALAGSSAVILMYHRFGESENSATNIRLEQFEQHLAMLADGPYTVLPVPEIVAALKAGTALPDRTIGITIDDAFASAYREAWPRLRRAGFPFTLFVSTEPVDKGYAGMMNWDQVRELAAAGVTIGHHTARHPHMTDQDSATNQDEIDAARARFTAELGTSPKLFAYPFGEYSLALEGMVAAAGFEAAFGQQSGVAYLGAGLFALPRFSMNEKYGDLARLRRAVNALPIPASEVTPADVLVGDTNPPNFGFTIAEPIDGLDALACYASGQGEALIERLGDKRFEVRIAAPFPPGRARINCTMPAPGKRWRWLGRQFVIPKP